MKSDKGYYFKDGILDHTAFQDPGKEWVRVVVPKQRRREVVDPGHWGLVGGLFSHKLHDRKHEEVFYVAEDDSGH